MNKTLQKTLILLCHCGVLCVDRSLKRSLKHKQNVENLKGSENFPETTVHDNDTRRSYQGLNCLQRDITQSILKRNT